MTDDLLTDITDGVGTITFNRPDKLNALSPAIVEGLIDVTHRFEHDPAVRCVLIRGAGDTFMAGGDVEGFKRSLTEDRDAHLAGMERRVVTGHLAIHRLRRMPKPVITAVQGGAVGFGFSMVAAADMAIAGENAFLMLAYRHVGLTADGGISYFLPRIVGERRAIEILMMGERIPAAKALDWGLVNWVVPDAELQDRALAMARKLAAGPTRALGGAKRLVRTALENSWDEQSAREAESIAEMIATDDHLEGVDAFLEKRKPVFRGS
ncbi:enoyl-CoA hydratase [Sphingomonas sp. Leaf357]|uniref:enoyl-CoA hydratase n=1 Tax=Sphingomonas sp. Leaf357 TaxID=1736350 RepID=UPI000A6E82F9|nr:enoyl-CoA hydratase [Sphingomonas sp. Leaf357]